MARTNKAATARLNAAIAGALKHFRPPESLTVDEWADKYRRLSPESSAEAGPWRTKRTPYLEEPMKAFTDPKVRKIVMVAASQVGKSELELNIIGYIIDQDPGSILYVHPTIDDARKFSRLRVAPMIRDSRQLKAKVHDVKSRDSGNTILQKSFPGGMLTLTGSNSASALASTPARYIIGDERDRWATSAGTEGDPWALAEARQATFYNAKAVEVSTPTIKGASNIETSFHQGTQERWCHLCPECGEYHEIVFDDIHFEPEATRIRGKKTWKLKGGVSWICPGCGCLIPEETMRRQPAKWIAENPDAYLKGVRSFWLNAFSSPLSMTDRIRLEEKIKAGKSKKQAAEELGFHISTIYRELKRGTYEHLNSDYTTEIRYSPDIADEKYRINMKAKGAPIKLGNDYALANYIETKIADEKYSPGAVLGEIKRLGLQFSVTISKPTLYRYIELGVFGRITNADLPEKCKKKQTHRSVRVKRPPAGESIENRPPEVDDRNTFGHWEMDTVVSAGHAKETLLVLTERLTRHEFMILMPDRTAASVVKAINRIEWKFGKYFPEVFKTITCDNGVEFSDCYGLEKKRRGKGKRTKVYYCHPYSSYERGSNEKQNRMIRRWLPKGTSFATVSKEEVARIEEWLNNYPREILDFETSAALFERHLEAIMSAA